MCLIRGQNSRHIKSISFSIKPSFRSKLDISGIFLSNFSYEDKHEGCDIVKLHLLMSTQQKDGITIVTVFP